MERNVKIVSMVDNIVSVRKPEYNIYRSWKSRG
jgi:hypothetical protein